MLECGHARELKLGTIADIFSGLGARSDVRVFWHGPELDRLLDAAHAALSAAVKSRLERWSWIVEVEVTYSRYGERGRIDLLAWHPATGILLVVEIKTDFVDVQALLGTLDAKARLGRHVAERFGWKVRTVIPAIVFTEDRTIRNRLGRVVALFDRFGLRGRAAISWLRNPGTAPSGLLWFVTGVEAPSRAERPRVRPHGNATVPKSARPGAH
ncbi:MAG: hypothetical protein ACRDGD_11845 [Candidatus Limnocylindria bacterium]